MKLTFTGYGSAFNFEDGSNSAYFTHDNHLYIIDSGETTYHSLRDAVDFNTYQSVTYLITHLHNDHIGSIGTAISDLYLNKGIVVNIVHPLKTMLSLLDLMGIESKMYTFIETTHYTKHGIEVIYQETTHVDNMTCFGFTLIVGDETIYYSGDANKIPEHILKDFLSKNIHCIYQDTCIHKDSSKSHLHLDTLKSLIPHPERSRIVCMHLEPNSQEIIVNEGFKIAPQ